MNEKELINLLEDSQKIFGLEVGVVIAIPVLILLLIAVLFALLSLFSERRAKKDPTNKDKHKENSKFFDILIIVSIMLATISPIFLEPFSNKEEVEINRKNLYDYVESLEYEKHEIKEMTFGNLEEYSEKRTIYTKEVSDLISVSVIYKDNLNEKKLKTKALIKYDLKDGESPYIEFIKLKDERQKKILYNTIIHY